MSAARRRRGIAVLATLIGLQLPGAVRAGGSSADVTTDWPQFGGSRRDFAVEAGKLADRWPEGGPRELWSRPLGHGYACVLVEGGRLYTGYRHAAEEKDVLACLDADTGRTIWETAVAAEMKPGMQLDFGEGPNATALIAGDRLFTVSAVAGLNVLDKRDGKLLWSKDLMAEYQTSHNGRGYSSSPLAYENLLIVSVGGRASGIAAFEQASGELVWKTEAFGGGGHSSPVLATVAGQPQLIFSQATQRVGVDPKTGAVLWKLAVPNQFAAVIATPLWLGPDTVLFSAGYGGGTHVLKILRTDAGFEAKELWHNRAMKVHHGNIIRLDERHVVASSGDFGPAFLMCLDIETGDVKWRERGYEKCTLLLADGKLLLLDQTGRLVLARATPEKFEAISECRPLQDKAWTAPTLVGTRLYLRDLVDLKCLDLSASANP